VRLLRLTKLWQIGAAILMFGLLSHSDIAVAQEQIQDQGLKAGFANFFKRSDQRAVELLEEGQYEQAAEEFDNPQWRGVSRFRGGKYKEAMEDFAVAEDATGLYNHGTAAVRAGDYTQAVSSFEKALKLAPDDTNISHNLDIAKKLKDLAEQQQQEQQPNEQQGEQPNEQQDEQEEGEQSESQDNEQSDEDSQSQSGEEESSESESGESRSDDSQSDDSQSDNDSDMDCFTIPGVDFDEMEQVAVETGDFVLIVRDGCLKLGRVAPCRKDDSE